MCRRCETSSNLPSSALCCASILEHDGIWHLGTKVLRRSDSSSEARHRCEGLALRHQRTQRRSHKRGLLRLHDELAEQVRDSPSDVPEVLSKGLSQNPYTRRLLT